MNAAPIPPRHLVIGAAFLIVSGLLVGLWLSHENPDHREPAVTSSPARPQVQSPEPKASLSPPQLTPSPTRGHGLPVAAEFPPTHPDPRIDSEVRRQIKEHMKASITARVESSYGDFISGLPADMQDKFRSLLISQRMAMADSIVPGQPPPPIEKVLEQNKAMETELQQALGDQGYRQMTEYRKTIPTRSDISELAASAAASGVPLSPEQSNSLLQVLSEERNSYLQGYANARSGASPASVSVAGGQVAGQQASPAPDIETIKAFEEGRVAADERALNRAAGFLSSAQADLLQQVLQSNARNSRESRPAKPEPLTPRPRSASTEKGQTIPD